MGVQDGGARVQDGGAGWGCEGAGWGCEGAGWGYRQVADEWPLVLSCSISLPDCCRPFISDGRPLFDALKLRGLFMWAPGVCVPDLLYLWLGEFKSQSLVCQFRSLQSLFLKIERFRC